MCAYMYMYVCTRACVRAVCGGGCIYRMASNFRGSKFSDRKQNFVPTLDRARGVRSRAGWPHLSIQRIARARFGWDHDSDQS